MKEIGYRTTTFELAGTLAGDRAREFTEKLRVAGVPI